VRPQRWYCHMSPLAGVSPGACPAMLVL
jgi:hypothetical protein